MYSNDFPNLTPSNGHTDGPPQTVLTIAGHDPTGGAGITADLKVIQQFGLHGLSVVTAVTVQNTNGVISTNPVSADVVKAQLYALAADMNIDAIKIGMLTTADVVRVVAKFVEARHVPVVLDPIIASSNNVRFLEDEALTVLRNELLPRATIVTPNLPETAAFTGIEVVSEHSCIGAALELYDRGANAVLIKGGHATGETSRDLFYDGTSIAWISSARVTKEVHGTGCMLSSAIACGLASGMSLIDSVHRAKEFITSRLGHTIALGSGQEIFQFPPLFLN